MKPSKPTIAYSTHSWGIRALHSLYCLLVSHFGRRLADNGFGATRLHPHLADIVAILRQIGPELHVLLVYRVLANMWEQEHCERSRKHTECRRHEDGVLASLDRVSVNVLVVQDAENLSPDVGADLADSGGDTVVLPTYCSCACL